MNSRITQLAAAALLALSALLVVRLVTTSDRVVTPGYEQPPVAAVPGEQDRPAENPTVEEKEQLRLAREQAAAKESFAKSDTRALVRLLYSGLDQTKITVAGYLGQIGDQVAVPALQMLADQWQGPAGDNPFRKSIEQIQNTSAKPDKTGPESRSGKQSPPVSAAARIDGPCILVHVVDKDTGKPIPEAKVRWYNGTELETHLANDTGVYILDLGASVPNSLAIIAAQDRYVSRSQILQDLSREKLPMTVRIALDRGLLIGGVVRDGEGRPVEGAAVDVSVMEERPGFVSVHFTETTDAEGRWRTASVPQKIGRLWLNVHHPEFAVGMFTVPQILKLEDLQAERAVMVLDKGLRVTGRVTDAGGKPIAGAGVAAGQDYQWAESARTDSAGNFELPHVRAPFATFLLTVRAPGFTPQQREVPAEKDLAPLEFVLGPARVLIGRVVDQAEHPLEGASVMTMDWGDYRTLEWRAKTDAMGMFVWDSPPADAIRIRITKPGYRTFERPVVANDREQTFVLVTPTTIKGTVVDSQTKERIKWFKVVPGAHWPEGDPRAVWQDTETWVKWFTDGRYSYEFTEDGLAYAVRIEADGYLPFESRFVDANEVEATIDIALSRGQGPSGYVFDANGAPVAGAEVTWGNDPRLAAGPFPTMRNSVSVKTDSEGHFVFKPEDREDPFAVVCDQGTGTVSYDDLVRDGTIRLAPWARVQGDLRIGTKPGVNRRLQLMYHPGTMSSYGATVSEATTDENGRFVFGRVHPGKFTLYDSVYEVEPGQTLELHLGGTGRTVKGELVLPGASEVVQADLVLIPANEPWSVEPIPAPAGYEQMSYAQVRAWLQRFYTSEEGKAWREKASARRHKVFRVEMDGRRMFHADNVEPGAYLLWGHVRGVEGREVIARLWHHLEVPPFARPGDMDTPLDLGAVPVLRGTLGPGDPAPDFDATAAGEGRVRLTDYRGKVVLVTLLDWLSVEPNSPAVQELKSVHQRFRENTRYTQLVLQVPAQPLLDKKAAEEVSLDWPVGVLQEQSSVPTEYGAESVPCNILIGPGGNVLAIGLSGEALAKAIGEALRAPQ